MENLTFPKGALIVKQNDTGDKMYYIESGTVEISLESKDNNSIPLAKLGAGEFFGELSFYDDKVRSATVTASTEVKLKVIEKDKIPYTLEKTPEWFQELFKKLIERIRNTDLALIHQAEEKSELSKKERLQAAIEVAGAAAHEINQPLSVLLSSCEILKRHEIPDKFKDYIDGIMQASLRISKIVAQMQVIRKYVTKPYVGDKNILDFSESAKET